MATTAALIDEYLTDQEGLPLTDLRARRRFLRNLQRYLDYLWGLRDYPWSVTSTTPTIINAGGRTYLDIAAGELFNRLGPQGTVMFDQRRLGWVPKVAMEEAYLSLSSGRTGQPEAFTDAELTGAGNPSSWAIYVFPPVPDPVGHTASIAYKSRSPILGDTGYSPPDATDNINLFPDQWHRPLLYEGGVMYAMKDKANFASMQVQRQIVAVNEKNFLATERSGSSAAHYLVPPFRRRLYR